MAAYFTSMENIFSEDFISGIANLGANDCLRNCGILNHQSGFRGRGRGHCGRGGRNPHWQHGAFMNGTIPFFHSWGFSDASPPFYPYFNCSRCSNKGKCCLHGETKQRNSENNSHESETSKNRWECNNLKQEKSNIDQKSNTKSKSCEEKCECDDNDQEIKINPTVEAVLGIILEPFLSGGNSTSNQESHKKESKSNETEEKDFTEKIPDEVLCKNIIENKEYSEDTKQQSQEIQVAESKSEISNHQPWRVTFDLKDIDPKSINVQVKEGTLRISGKSVTEHVEDGWTSHQESSRVYERSIPRGVSSNGITASLSTEGNLTVVEKISNEIPIIVEDSGNVQEEESSEINKSIPEESESDFEKIEISDNEKLDQN